MLILNSYVFHVYIHIYIYVCNYMYISGYLRWLECKCQKVIKKLVSFTSKLHPLMPILPIKNGGFFPSSIRNHPRISWLSWTSGEPTRRRTGETNREPSQRMMFCNTKCQKHQKPCWNEGICRMRLLWSVHFLRQSFSNDLSHQAVLIDFYSQP